MPLSSEVPLHIECYLFDPSLSTEEEIMNRLVCKGPRSAHPFSDTQNRILLVWTGKRVFFYL